MAKNKNTKKQVSTSSTSYFRAVCKEYRFSLTLIHTLILFVIIAYIDMIDYPSQLIERMDAEKIIIIGFIVILLLFSWIIKKHIFELPKLFITNLYDRILQMLFGWVLLYAIFIYLSGSAAFYKIVSVSILFITNIILISIRHKLYYKVQKRIDNYDSNVIDLKDLYENKVTLADTNDLILLNESDVDYDLLKRDSIINHLVHVLLNTRPNGKFVIGLEGKWGSGKTTILKNVKKIVNNTNKDIVIIDDFDPWAYATEEQIVENLLTSIMNHSDFNINTSDLRRNIKLLTNAIVSSSNKFDFIQSLFFDKRDLNICKEQINAYFRNCDKRFIIYLDNIDRVDDDKIIFLFKLIGNVLDFEKVTYVVSFDSEKIRNIFDLNLNIDYSFMKKIIQMQIIVPEIDQNIMNDIVSTCTSNIISLFDKAGVKKEEYNDIIMILSEKFNDLRDFKRFINSILIRTFMDKSNLSKKNKLILEYIKSNNYALYSSIYENRCYYVSEDTIYDSDLSNFIYSPEDFNQKGKEYFDHLFLSHLEYKDLLEIIFPYVKKYNNNQPLKSTTTNGINEEYQFIAKNNGISSAKYFDLYFSETENRFSILGGFIEDFISLINNNPNSINDEIISWLAELNSSMQKEFFEKIELYIPDINKSSIYPLLSALFDNIWNVADTSIFLGLSARSRCIVIIEQLLHKITDGEFKRFINSVEVQYDKILIVDEISYWLDNDTDNLNQKNRKERWNELKHKIMNDVIQTDIDIYEDKYYHLHNLWALFRFYKDDLQVVKKYVNNHLNEKNIYRILYDVVGHSIGSEHCYYIQNSSMKYLDEKKIEIFMKTITPNTDDEKFLVSLYEKYLESPNDEYGRKTNISFETEKILTL